MITSTCDPFSGMGVILEMGEDKEYKITRQSEYEAWCSSYSCARGQAHQNLMKIKVNAKPSDTFCPDCGYALLWMKAESKAANGKFVKIHQ